MKCTVMLHRGVCHRTSTPHKSGNKMMEKKTFLILMFMSLHKQPVKLEL